MDGFQRGRAVSDAQQGGIDAVRAGAGHEADQAHQRTLTVQLADGVARFCARCVGRAGSRLASSGAACCLNSRSSRPVRLSASAVLTLRVAMDAVDPQFVVQVRAGGKAGGSDVADGLAGADRRANRCPLAKRLMCA